MEESNVTAHHRIKNYGEFHTQVVLCVHEYLQKEKAAGKLIGVQYVAPRTAAGTGANQNIIVKIRTQKSVNNLEHAAGAPLKYNSYRIVPENYKALIRHVLQYVSGTPRRRRYQLLIWSFRGLQVPLLQLCTTSTYPHEKIFFRRTVRFGYGIKGHCIGSWYQMDSQMESETHSKHIRRTGKMFSEYGVIICSEYKNIGTKATVFTIKMIHECLKI